jgi:hypothetical protein
MLETETAIPPIDLYLTGRAAAFEARIIRTGKLQLLYGYCEKAASIMDRARARLRRRGRRPLPPLPQQRPQQRSIQTADWLGSRSEKEAVFDKWLQRWNNAAQQERTIRAIADEPPYPLPYVIQRYRGLLKHETSLICQVRTGRIGLRAFLFLRGVPDVPTPLCSCGRAPETPEHFILHCQSRTAERTRLRQALAPLPLYSNRDLATVTDRQGRQLASWLLATGRFPSYRLAEEIGGTRDPEKTKTKKGTLRRQG